MTALSFAFVNRGDIEERFTVRLSAKTVLDGSYTQNLDEVYSQTLPFSNAIRALGARLGFCDTPPSEGSEPDFPQIPDENTPSMTEPAVTEPAVTEPVVTDPPVTEPPVTEATEPTIPLDQVDTFTMYAGATINIRIGPSTEDAVIGYFISGNPVEVIELRDDGWAEILYDGIRAYVYSEYLEGGGQSSHGGDDSGEYPAEEIDPDEVQTFIMVANASMNIRTAPTTDGGILGTYTSGDEVSVIEIRNDGWAAIVYGNVRAYVFAEYLSEADIDAGEQEVVLPDGGNSESVEIPDDGMEEPPEELEVDDGGLIINSDSNIEENDTNSINVSDQNSEMNTNGNSTYNTTTDGGIQY